MVAAHRSLDVEHRFMFRHCTCSALRFFKYKSISTDGPDSGSDSVLEAGIENKLASVRPK
jgi:hypothetical protein